MVAEIVSSNSITGQHTMLSTLVSKKMINTSLQAVLFIMLCGISAGSAADSSHNQPVSSSTSGDTISVYTALSAIFHHLVLGILNVLPVLFNWLAWILGTVWLLVLAAFYLWPETMKIFAPPLLQSFVRSAQPRATELQPAQTSIVPSTDSAPEGYTIRATMPPPTAVPLGSPSSIQSVEDSILFHSQAAARAARTMANPLAHNAPPATVAATLSHLPCFQSFRVWFWRAQRSSPLYGHPTESSYQLAQGTPLCGGQNSGPYQSIRYGIPFAPSDPRFSHARC